MWCWVVYVVFVIDSVSISEVFEAVVRRISTWTFQDGQTFQTNSNFFCTEGGSHGPLSLSLSLRANDTKELVRSGNHRISDFALDRKRSTRSREYQLYGFDEERLRVTFSDSSPRLTRVLRDSLSPSLLECRVTVQTFGFWQPWPTPAGFQFDPLFDNVSFRLRWRLVCEALPTLWSISIRRHRLCRWIRHRQWQCHTTRRPVKENAYDILIQGGCYRRKVRRSGAS